MRILLGLLVMVLGLQTWAAGEAVPPAKSAGPGGKPACILIVGQGHGEPLDAKLRDIWTAEGYQLVTLPNLGDYSLTTDYLKAFGAVILTDLPSSADVYIVSGWRTAVTRDGNLAALHAYVEAGGGLFIVPIIGGGGQAVIQNWNDFLAPYDVKLEALQVRPSADYEPIYAPAEVQAGPAITEGVKSMLYPATVLRWDHSCSSYPVLPGKGWQVLLSAGAKDGSYSVSGNNSVFPERRSEARDLVAIGPAGKGKVIVCGISGYYVLSNAYQDIKVDHVGESGTGRIGGIMMEGEPGGQPSQFGVFFDRSLRYLAANSAANGLGTGTEALPEQPPMPESPKLIDWSKQGPPPTWRHRVLMDRHNWTFDEVPDPMITGEMHYYRALVGPRTAASVGSGDVKEWRDAAQAAGYQAIFFAEVFENTTPEKYRQLMADCAANSDDEFACVAGLDIEDSQGARYLLLGVSEWPDPAWLTPDGKRIVATNHFSLGFGKTKLVSYHRPGRSPLEPRMVKHFQAITVATYNEKGALIDDGMFCYQFEVASDSNPIPVAAHELTAPGQIAKAGTAGFQQIMPADSLHRAIDYFRHAFAHYFSCPVRYFISEGPILDGWSIFNKDASSAENHRDQYKMAIGVTGDAPLRTVTLYDGFDVARRWQPGAAKFETVIDGRHDGQHMYLLVGEDAKGRRVISPQIRTVTRNYRLRCGDRQNWLGTQPDWCIYAGWRQGYGLLGFPLRTTRETTGTWNAPAPIFDYPFFSNHVTITDIDGSKRYVNVTGPVYGDGKPVYAVAERQWFSNQVRVIWPNPQRRKDFGALHVSTTWQLERDTEWLPQADLAAALHVEGKDALVILPGQEPQPLSAKLDIPVPPGSFVDEYLILTPGLQLRHSAIGVPIAPEQRGTMVPKGTRWTMEYVQVRGKTWWWRDRANAKPIAPKLASFLAQAGVSGKLPVEYCPSRGTLKGSIYFTDVDADKGATAGRLEIAEGADLTYDPILRISGMANGCPGALWRSDRPGEVSWFGVFERTGYVTLPGDASFDLVAGSALLADPRLAVEVVAWDANHARFRLHNPTLAPVETSVESLAVPGFKALQTKVTVAPGTSIEVGE